jgi:dolichyl-phosphate-mannose--protein O-mannosyl transferase
MDIKNIIVMWSTIGVVIWIGMVIIIMLFLRGSKARLNEKNDEFKKQ